MGTVMGWLLLAVLGPFVGFKLGELIADAIERARWNRLALHVWTRAPMSTVMPTTTELHAGYLQEWRP